jgi:hypothetical protein
MVLSMASRTRRKIAIGHVQLGNLTRPSVLSHQEK